MTYITCNQLNHKKTLLESSLRIPYVQCVREVSYPPSHYVKTFNKSPNKNSHA